MPIAPTMRPWRNAQRLESRKHPHQLFFAIDFPDASTGWLINGARRAAGLRRPAYLQQAMAKAILCRETNQRIPRLALGPEDTERFAQRSDAAIGKRHDDDTRDRIRRELPRKRVCIHLPRRICEMNVIPVAPHEAAHPACRAWRAM